jgi:hypothetical protein
VLSRDSETSDPARLPSACPCCWAMGINKVKKCAVRKIIFCTGLTRAAKAGQKYIVPAQRAQRANKGNTPQRVPICLTVSRGNPPLVSLELRLALDGKNSSLCTDLLHHMTTAYFESYRKAKKMNVSIVKRNSNLLSIDCK